MDLEDAVRDAVEGTIAGHRETVDAWIQGRPKTWGFLAGQAVVACRRALGRPLAEPERRAVWDRLWRRLQELRAASGADGSP